MNKTRKTRFVLTENALRQAKKKKKKILKT